MNTFLIILLVFEGIALYQSLSSYYVVNKHPDSVINRAHNQDRNFMERVSFSEEELLSLASNIALFAAIIFLISFVITFITLI